MGPDATASHAWWLTWSQEGRRHEAVAGWAFWPRWPVSSGWGLIDDGALLVGDDGLLHWVGPSGRVAHARAAGDEVVELHGALVTPGLVDCHTHLVYGGNRAQGVRAAPARRQLCRHRPGWRRHQARTVAATRAAS